MRASFEERQHDDRWRDNHLLYMANVLAFQRAGYGRDESRRMAERHRIGEPILNRHNNGPELNI